VAASQDIPLFGRLGLRRDAMNAEARMLRADYRGAALQLLADTRGLYFDLCRVAAGRELNSEALRLTEETRRWALARYESGSTSMQDPLQLEVERGMLEHESAALGSRELQARARLAALLHLGPEAGASLPPAPAMPATTPGPGVPREGLDPGHPESASAQAGLDAALKREALAGKSGLPELRVEAAYDRFMDMPGQREMLGASVTLPFLWGRAGAEKRAAAADADAARLKLESTRVRLGADAQAAEAAAYESRHELELIRASILPASQEAYRSARAGYETSHVELRDVLMAQRSFADARLSERRAAIDLEQARAEIARVRGELPDFEEVKP
jgi:cobalt-zinc-cadmium efflux system outer membrane protein